MKRSTLVLGIVLAILCVPAAQTVASALGLGPAGSADVAASVYANVSDAACGYGYGSDASGYTWFNLCATDDHVRVDYSTNGQSASVPQSSPVSRLYFSVTTCSLTYQCSWRYYYGPMSADALTVDSLLGQARLRTTVTSMSDGAPCALDVTFVTPNGPTLGTQHWTNTDPYQSVALQVSATADAAATKTGSAGGSLCGRTSNGWGGVSRGAGLRVGFSAEARPTTP